jgi:selenocysteine-specific translation elongation factor
MRCILYTGTGSKVTLSFDSFLFFVFRMSISDVFKGQATGFSVCGRVESGCIMREDRVLCSPLNQICSVRGVLVDQGDSQTG